MHRFAFYFLVLLAIHSHAWGQMLTPTVVASSGDFQVNTQANLMIAFTVGEMTMVETFSAQNYHLTQGFHQPNNVDLVGLNDQDFVELFEVFPNPAAEDLHIRYDLLYAGNMTMRLFSMNGVEVVNGIQEKYDGSLQEHEIDLRHLAQGMYFLEVVYRVPSKGIDHTSHFKINVIQP